MMNMQNKALIVGAARREFQPANILCGTLLEEGEAQLPVHALEVARVAEKSERQCLVNMAEMLGGENHE